MGSVDRKVGRERSADRTERVGGRKHGRLRGEELRRRRSSSGWVAICVVGKKATKKKTLRKMRGE